MFFTLIVASLAKVFSNMFDTARTIYTQRSKAVIAAIMLTASSFTYNVAIKAIANESGYLVNAISSIASGLGCLLAIVIANKFFRELGVRILLSDKKETMQEFRNFMAKNHITNIAIDSYTHGSWDEKSITLITFPDTKDKDKLITNYAKQCRENGVKIKIVP